MVDISTLDVSEQPVSGDVLLIAGNGKLWTHPITQGTTTVGRTAECDIVVDDRALSRQQLEITLGPPLAIRDLGSTNGTKIGGKTHRGGVPIAITAGESFHVGPYTFMVIARARGPSTGHGSGRDLLLVEDPSPEAATSLVRDLARSAVNVLVTGESGVGKDVLAHTLHVLSGRSGPLQRINCAALPEQLLESELFGHERGAFTGAVQRRRGRLELAEGGTFFLDEIGELKPELQAKLLRVLQERTFERVGGAEVLTADVRWVAATNRELGQAMALGAFREDLYHRLAVFPIRLPPLRERRADLLPLAEHLLLQVGASVGKPGLVLTEDAKRALLSHEWPGNVRELLNTLERAAILADGRVLDSEHIGLSGGIAHVAVPATADAKTLQAAEKAAILEALAAVNGHRKKAAERLGIGERTLYDKLKAYGIR